MATLGLNLNSTHPRFILEQNKQAGTFKLKGVFR